MFRAKFIAVAMLAFGAISLPRVVAANPDPATNSPDDAAWSRLAELLDRGPDELRLRGRFEQRRSTPLLDEPIVSTGELRLADGVVRFDTLEPFPSMMHVDAGAVTLFYPNQNTAERYALGDDRGPMVALLRNELAPLRERYLLNWAEPSGETVEATLTPKPELDPQPSVVVFTLGLEHGDLRNTRVDDGDGNATELVFTEVQADADLTAADLTLELPADARFSDFSQKAPR